MSMDLNSLARTLAERLTTKLDEMVEFETFKNGRTAGFLRRGASEQAEEVIREAIDKTLERAHQITRSSVTWAEAELLIYAEMRSLKQSNSGMEVRK